MSGQAAPLPNVLPVRRRAVAPPPQPRPNLLQCSPHPRPLRLHRSHEQVVGIVATLESGGAYLPLDATWPLERRTFIVNELRRLLTGVPTGEPACLATPALTMLRLTSAFAYLLLANFLYLACALAGARAGTEPCSAMPGSLALDDYSTPLHARVTLSELGPDDASVTIVGKYYAD